MLHELIQVLRDRRHLLGEQTATEIAKNPLHDRERLQLGGREPQSWQLVGLFAGSPSIHEAAALRIELDRRVQVILHRLDDAIQRRARALEPRHQAVHVDRRAPVREDRVELEDAVEFVHPLLAARADEDFEIRLDRWFHLST